MKILVCLSLGLTVIHASADKLDEHQRQGLSDTQSMLKSRSQRDEYIKTDKRAKDVDDKVGALAGSAENKDEIYGLSSQVLERVVAEAKGDPVKMQEILTKAQQDPKGFYEKYFDENQKQGVRGIANKIEQRKTKTGPNR